MRRSLERTASAASSTSAGGLPKRQKGKKPEPKPHLLSREHRVENWPAGPETSEQLMNWPLAVVTGLQKNTEHAAGEELVARLKGNLLRTMAWVTDYSGMDCVRESMETVVNACRTHLGWCYDKPPVEFLRSCDNGEIQTHLLTSIAAAEYGGRPCHFMDLKSRLPQPAQDYLAAAMPDKKASAKVREEAFQHVSQWVADNQSWLYPPDATCHCKVHDKDCPVWPRRADEAEGEGRENRPLRINAAGVSCQGWSREGLGLPKAHFSEVAHAIWLNERKVVMSRDMEDLAFSECTVRYPAVQRYEAAFGDGAKIVSLCTGPELMGWPCKRLRRLTAIINRQSLVWLGPETEEALEADFLERFYRGIVIDGTALLTADTQDRLAEYKRIATNRRNQLDQDMIHTTDDLTSMRVLAAVLPPGAIDKLMQYERHRVKKYGANRGAVLMCDAEHNLGTGSTCGPDWPVHLTHGSIVALKDSPSGTLSWTMATIWEHFESMGFIMRQRDGGLPVSKLLPHLRTLQNWQLKQLCGNGMHLMTQGAWMAYVLSNVGNADWRRGKTVGMHGMLKRSSCSWIFESEVDGDDEER